MPDAKRQGLTRLQVAAVVSAQGGRCALCRRPLGERFAIDHCHACALAHGHDAWRGCPNEFRGALCESCNSGLGAFADDPEVLLRAATYVKHGRH